MTLKNRPHVYTISISWDTRITRKICAVLLGSSDTEKRVSARTMYKIWMKLRNDERETQTIYVDYDFFLRFYCCVAKAFDLMVCSSSYCLSEPIYNDARINAKSKTHKNRNRASASDEREQLDVGLLFFFIYFILFCYIFLSKYAYPMHVPHYLQTQSRYIIIMSRSWSLVFFFLFGPYVCDLIQSSRLLSYYIHWNACPEKIWLKCQKNHLRK